MLPSDSKLRKDLPIVTGVLDYFPDAIAYVALVSKVGNDKHNPGEPMHWARGKSDDHENCIGRHLVDRHGAGDDGILHAGNLAWRALANLQLTIEGYQRNGVDVFNRQQHALPVGKSLTVGAGGQVEAGVDDGRLVTINEAAHGDGDSGGPGSY